MTAPETTAPTIPRLSVTELRHELRTPLNQIIGYSEMLQEEAAELGQESFVADLAKIERAGRRLLGLINELTSGKKGDPLPAAPEPGPPAPRVEEQAAHRPGAAENLLVVDDSEENRDLLARRLQHRGFVVHTAAGGREAMALLSTRSFDLVLLDVMMPEVSGLDVLKVIRTRRSLSDLPVIMATARDASEDIVEALSLGANDYVTKPLDFAVVMARVETQLALKRARDQVQLLNRRLDNAQRQIARLQESSSDAVRDVAGWARAVSVEVCRTVHASDLGVWVLEDSKPRALNETETLAPSLAEFNKLHTTGQTLARRTDSLVPVLGLSGEIFGALVVRGERTLRGEAPDRVLASFARQLGGALELSRTRQALAAAAERNRASRQQMLERGVPLARICPACKSCHSHEATHCDVDGTELVDLGCVPYRIADRYCIVRLLGEGGMATVFEARDERLARMVAVKIVKQEYFNNETIRQRFAHEARAVARVDHRGVATVFDSGELDDGSYFIVMERLFGRDLGQMIRDHGPGTPVQVASMLTQAAEAVGAAHRARLVHRDLKPENIFLTPCDAGFSVKVLDFGVAKEISAETHLTQTGTVIGTPLFMSPEQILCKPVDARSDIYSLAAVAFLALAGRRITRGETFPAILLETVQGTPPRLSEVVAGIPAALDEAFAQALSMEASHRPADIEQWARSVASLLSPLPSGVTGWAFE